MSPWEFLKFPVDDLELLHNMEQCGVIVLSDVSSLHGMASSLRLVVRSYLDGGKLLVMVPCPDEYIKVVLGTWTHLMKLDNFDEEAIRSFIDVHERRYRLKKS